MLYKDGQPEYILIKEPVRNTGRRQSIEYYKKSCFYYSICNKSLEPIAFGKSTKKLAEYFAGMCKLNLKDFTIKSSPELSHYDIA